MQYSCFFKSAKITPYRIDPPNEYRVKAAVKEIVNKILFKGPYRSVVKIVEEEGREFSLYEISESFNVRTVSLGFSLFHNYNERQRELSHFHKESNNTKIFLEVVLKKTIENEQVKKAIPKGIQLKINFKTQEHVWNNYSCEVFGKIVLVRAEPIPVTQPTYS